jgi:predicted Fe-Mo cluster-binding NifX family protein
MSKVIGIPSNGPELADPISEHFGHCLYFVGIKLNEDNTYEKTFSLPNNGHSSCMEPVINMKNRAVTEMIVGGIGGRPYMGFIQMGINLYQGIQGETLEQNIALLLEGKLKPLGGPSCGEGQNHNHSN